MRVHLIEPHSSGRISGGYLYNQTVVQGNRALERHTVTLSALDDELAKLELREPGLVLFDSLFLTPELAPSFLRLRRHRLAIGVLMHAFPSFIERARDRQQLMQALPLLPSRDELGLLEQLDLLVAPGPYIPRLLAQCGSSVRSVICPPGIDRSPPPGAPPRTQTSQVRLISIGGVTPLKGLADGLQALASIRPAGWSWSIVGHVGLDPEHMASLRGLAHQFGLGSSVHFKGQLSHEETLAELRQSDLLLIPSHTENCPLVALEALSAAVPVVGYAVGGLPDIIRHDETGLLAPLLDVTTLGTHLSRLTHDVEQRRRFSDNCVEAARNLMSWQESAHHFRSTLEREAALHACSAALPHHE